MGGFSMYSVVLMVAATSGGDMASFGKDKGGCSGCSGYTASCNGGGFLGLKDKMGCHGCSGGGFLGMKDKHGCSGGGCHGSSMSCHGGCTGTVVHSAPVVEHHAAPAGCHGSSCHGSSCHGCSGSSCHGGGFLGMRDGGGLFKKHKSSGCHGCSGGCW